MRDRVAHQIRQHPHQRTVAADHPDGFVRHLDLQRHSGALGGYPVGVQHVIDHLVECHPLIRGGDGTGVDLGHLEEVVHHLGEPDAFLLDSLGLGAHLRFAHHTVGDRLRERPDPGQRSAQVVAHEGHELAAGPLGRPFGILNLLLPHRSSGLVAGQHQRGRQCHHRDDDQHHGDHLEVGRGHEAAGAEHAGEGRHGGDQHQRHHADRHRPRPGEPDDQRADQHHRK